MEIQNKDTKALVIKKCDDIWDMVNVTEYLSDDTWCCGMNLLTSIDDVLDTAEKNGLTIIFESMLDKGR